MDIDTHTDCTRSLLGERVVFPRGGELPLDFWERDWWAELELVSIDAGGTKLMRPRRAPKSKEGTLWPRVVRLIEKLIARSRPTVVASAIGLAKRLLPARQSERS